MATTRVTQHVRASRADVYRALLDADAVQHWMVPDGMTSEVHEFDAREGGEFSISLTYDEPAGTDVVGIHEGLPPGVSVADNELGWQMSLGKLAAFVEAAGVT